MAPKPALNVTLKTADTLLTQYLEVLGSTPAKNISLPDAPPPLPLLSDCARLLKAQVTKLSLLAINKPFTPSAIATVLHDIVTSCMPAMMSAVQICDNQRDLQGGFFVDEVRARVRRVTREMLGLVKEVTAIAEEVKNNQHAREDSVGRDSLSSTGIVWSGCDEIAALAVAGVAGLAVQKAEAYRDMIKDAISELQEWREGNDTANEGTEDNLLDSDDEGVDGDRDTFDDIFNAANSLPADRVELRELVETAENKLKKVVLLYTGLVRRRFKNFLKHPAKGDEEAMRHIEKTMVILKNIPNLVDEMVSSFYELDEESSRSVLDELLGQAVTCATIMQRNSLDADDSFTNWIATWKEAIAGTSEGG